MVKHVRLCLFSLRCMVTRRPNHMAIKIITVFLFLSFYKPQSVPAFLSLDREEDAQS